MPKYNLTIGFRSDRELTENELGNLQMDCIAQIDDPMIEGERVDFKTLILGSDIDEVKDEKFEYFSCGSCGESRLAEWGKVSIDSEDHKSFTCNTCRIDRLETFKKESIKKKSQLSYESSLEPISEEFCDQLVKHLKNYDVENEMVYTGGGFWLVRVPLKGSCHIEAGDGGANLCDATTGEHLAIISTITEIKDLALFIKSFVSNQ